MTEPDVHPLLRPSLRVTRDLACSACGYNLRTLAWSGRCPECGWPVTESRDETPRRRLRVALNRFALGFAVSAVGFAAAIAMADLNPLETRRRSCERVSPSSQFPIGTALAFGGILAGVLHLQGVSRLEDGPAKPSAGIAWLFEIVGWVGLWMLTFGVEVTDFFAAVYLWVSLGQFACLQLWAHLATLGGGFAAVSGRMRLAILFTAGWPAAATWLSAPNELAWTALHRFEVQLAVLLPWLVLATVQTIVVRRFAGALRMLPDTAQSRGN